MAASVQCRPQERTLGMVMKEVDEDLAIFLQMRRSAKEREDHIRSEIFEQFNDLLFEKTEDEIFMRCENERSDYDWLLSPPHSPSYPSTDEEEEKDGVDKTGKHSDSTELDLMPIGSPKDISVQSYASSGRSTSSNSKNSCSAGNSIRLSSSGRGRPRAKSSRPSTPTSRASLPSAKITTSSHSSGKTSMPSSIPATSKPASRSATPIRRTSIHSTSKASVAKTDPIRLKKPESARGTSPNVKSRPSSSHGVPTNPHSSIPKRPASASRGRPSASYVQSTTAKTGCEGKPRHRSASPSTSQAKNNSLYSHWSASLSRSRGYNDDEDDVNPVLVGTKMVERVVNMRKLAPPKLADDHQSSKDSSKKPSASQKSSSFGTSFSKRSLDMAIRHMDIRRSSNGNARRVTKRAYPASSVVKRTTGVSQDSGVETSINNGSHHCDQSEVGDS